MNKTRLHAWHRVGIAFAALVLLGAGYQQITQAVAKATYVPPGELVKVNGGAMHLYCSGEGTPTVVLEAGATGFAQSWVWVQRELEQTSRVCSYDRAGMGWSEDQAARHTGVHAAHNLNALLTEAGEKGPYIVVGHSMGGPIAQIFAGMYPDKVVGVGLIDPSHPDQLSRYGGAAQRLLNDFTQTLKLASWMSYTGVVRATDLLARHAEGLPQDAYKAAEFFASSHRHLFTSYQELEHWDTTMAAAKSYMELGDKPLLVVSATEGRSDFPQNYVRRFQQLHKELATISSESRHLKINGADHFTLLTERPHAQKTARAISQLVERVRAPVLEKPEDQG